MSQFTAPPPPPIPQRYPASHPRGRRVPILFGIGLTLVVILVIACAAFRFSNASAIRKLEAEVRARGEPLTLTELQTSYASIPDQDNAALALIQIWQQEEPEFWEAFLSGDYNLPERSVRKYDPALPYLGSEAKKIPRGEPLSPASVAAVDEFITTNATRFAAVQTALLRPQSRFPVNMPDGLAALLPHLPSLRQEASYFQIAALAAAEHNDAAGALAALRNIARCGQVLAKEPMLISQLVRLASMGMMVGGVEQWLSRQPLQPDDLEQLRQLLEASQLRGVARFSLVSERPFSLSAFDPKMAAFLAAGGAVNDDAEAQSTHKTRTGFKLLRATGYLGPDQRLMLEAFRDGIVLAEQETPESLSKYEALFDAVDSRARKLPPKFFSAMLLPPLKKVGQRFAGYEAQRRAALAALAVEGYRRNHGDQLPARLEELLPGFLSSVPIDPFDGQPLRFQKLERGYVIYSVGQDRNDNDGIEHTRGTREGTDITFTVLR